MDNYFVAIGADGRMGFTAARKIALVVHCLGTEGRRIYNTVKPAADPEEPPTYEAVMDFLQGHFEPPLNEVTARHEFRKRRQLAGETVDQFVTALRSLCLHCNFGTTEDTMIRDQLVQFTSDTRVRQRLLQEADLKLDKAQELARTVERSQKDNLAMQHELHQGAESVRKVKPWQGKKGGKAWKSEKSSGFASGQGSQGPSGGARAKGTCERCGREPHPRSQCPAVGRTCHKCKRKDHFASQCRSKQSEKVRHVAEEEFQSDDEYRVYAVSQKPFKGQDDVTLNFRIRHPDGQWTTTKLLVDTGSPICLISEDDYYEWYSDFPLLPAPKSVGVYDSGKMKIVGRISTMVGYGDRTTVTSFYVVKSGGEPLLGKRAFENLGFVIQDYGGQRVCSVQVKRKRKSPAPAPQEIPKPPAPSSGKLNRIKSKFPMLFRDEPGKLKGYRHRIRLKPDSTPVAQKLRRVPFAIREAVNKELLRLEKHGLIERIDGSEWVQNMVPVVKSNGSIRICVDLKELNPNVIMDQYPLPTVDDLVLEVGDAKVFSKLDLKKAFYQVELDPESRHLTAFITEIGLFQFRRMPMGLNSAPAAFQRIIDNILQGLPGHANGQDDVLVFGRDAKEHDERLEAILKRLEGAGACVELSKLEIGKDEIDFYGHRVSAKGIQPKESNVAAIMGMPPPIDKTQISSFLSTVSYYGRFIPRFATIVEPLRKIVRKDGVFQWTKTEEAAWDEVRRLIATAAPLGFFDVRKETIVTTDASNYGLGATLSQIHDGEEVVVSYASHTLSECERRYSATEREALACVWAVEKWRIQLWGRPFTLRTDHQALKSLLTAPLGKGHKPFRLARWYMRLADYRFDVQYKPGHENNICDMLSRLPLPNPSQSDIDNTDRVARVSLPTALRLPDLGEATKKDPELQRVIRYLGSGWIRKPNDASLAPYYMIRHELSQDGDVLLRGTNTVVVPRDLRKRALDLGHEGHPGIVRTKARLKEHYWWPGIGRDAEAAVVNCDACARADKSAKVQVPPVVPVPLPVEPWEKLALDIAGPFATAPPSERFLIVLIDYMSKWVEVACTGQITSGKVISFLETVFGREGFPETVVTDNGSQFVSREMEEYLSECGIRHVRSALYNPTANSQVERVNRTLKEGIQAATMHGLPWKQALKQVLTTYRSTPHRATGRSPFELLRGRKMRTKMSVRSQSTSRDRAIQDHVQKYQDTYRKDEAPTRLKVGDWVRTKLPSVGKGKPGYSEPLEIVRSKGPHTFVLSNGAVWNDRKLAKSKASKGTAPQDDSDFPFAPYAGVDGNAPHAPELANLAPAEDHDFDQPHVPVAVNPRRSNRDRRQADFYQAGFA